MTRRYVIDALVADGNNGSGAFGTRDAAANFVDSSGVLSCSGYDMVFAAVSRQRDDGDPRVNAHIAKVIIKAMYDL